MKPVRTLAKYCAILFSLTCVASDTNAEIYKWVDDSGNIHFGDRPPKNQRSKEIGSTLKPLNLSTDLADQTMLIEAEKERRQAGKSNSPAHTTSGQQETINQWCKDARARLNSLRGPVVFFDDDGNEVKVSEHERKQREAALTKEIDDKC
jgi:hypothetical protein